jgi:hypothetical protein
VQLHRDRDSVAEAGARLVFIGQATPPHAAHFRRTQGIELPVLVDAERLSYKAAGAKLATMHELLGPLVVAKGVVAIARHGVFQGRAIGDFAQLGGVMIIGVGGTIIWSHMSEDASDIASSSDILRALQSNGFNARARRSPTVVGA